MPRSTGKTTGVPEIPYAESIIYEAHVKGLSALHP